MCTFGLSDCRVEPRQPHQSGPPGLAHDTKNSKRAHFSPGASKNPTKIPRKDPQEREERKKIVAGEGKKSAKFWAPHPSGPTLRAPPFGAHPSGRHPWVRPSLAKTKCGTINIVRVSVKASPAEGRRRLHTNTACVHLSFQRAFMWSIAGLRPAMLHMKVC